MSFVGSNVWAALEINKSADTTSAVPGQTVAYTIEITNTGPDSETNVVLEDDLAGVLDDATYNNNVSSSAGSCTFNALTINCSLGTLSAGAVVTATYSVTVNDPPSGDSTLINTATANSDGGTPISDEVTVPISVSPQFTFQKSATPSEITAAGQIITYSFAVTNSGNVTLNNITVNESAFSGTGTLSAITCPTTTLAPEESTVCTATYTATQEDINAGVITNTATAQASYGSVVLLPASSSAAVTATPAAALTLQKTASPTIVNAAGEQVTYSFTVTNTGNVTLSGLAINDVMAAPATPGNLSAITCPDTTLAPGAETTCTATYTVSQADVDNGSINNSATATGSWVNGTVISESSSASVAATPTTALTLQKTASPTTVNAAGEQVTYSFTVMNTGNVTLRGLAINDVIAAPATPDNLSAITCPDTTLAPGAETTCTATYTVSQADLNAGNISNTATASGMTPNSFVVTSAPSTTTVQATAQASSLTLNKSADIQSFSYPGVAITYTYLVTNTGTVVLNNIAVTDSQINMVSCPATALNPGASMACKGTYVTTIKDVQQGGVTNIGTATAAAPNGTTLSVQSALTVEFNPDLIRKKTLSAVRNFLSARTQLILTASPDRYRLIRKLSQQKKACTDTGSFGNIRPTSNGATLNGSISSSQFSINPTKLDLWVEVHGAYYNQNRFENSRHGNFGVLYVGLDYLFMPSIVGGILAQGDVINQNESNHVNNAHGSGWLLGPYVSTKLNSNLYLHTRAGWGESNNKINPLGYYDDSFTTVRSLYNAELVGDFKLKNLLVMPTAGMTYYSENQHHFTNALNVLIPGQTVSLGQLNFGPEFAYQFNTLRCKEIGLRFTIQGLYNFNQSHDSFIDDEFFIPVSRFSGRTKLALDVLFPSGFSLSPMVTYDGIGTNSYNAVQAQIQFSAPFG